MTLDHIHPDLFHVSFLKALHGVDFVGFQLLFKLPSRNTTSFDVSEWPALAAEIDRLKDTVDLYGVIGTQSVRVGGAKRGSVDTVVQVSGLIIDVDFASKKASGKIYVAGAKEARLVRDTLIHPPSAVVATGNGEHWHWFFDSPILIKTEEDRQQAKDLSRNFSRAMQAIFREHGAEIDSIGDIARAFRLPGTFNHKGGEKKPVILAHFEPTLRYSVAMLDEFSSPPSLPSKPTRRPSHGFAPARHEAIRQGCSWYFDATGMGAASASEPEWFAAASITACCQDPEETFHTYSRHYHQYDQREAQGKIEQAIKSRTPRTCASIESDLGYEGCLSCSYHGKIKSPVQIGSGSRRYEHGDEGPIPLGYTRDGNFALRDPVRNIIITASAQQLLSVQWLQGVAPSTFWKRQFATEKSFNSTAAGEAIIAACKAVGPFNPTLVRGRGIWMEDGEVVINLGGQLREGLKNQYLCFEPIALPANPTFDTVRLSDLLDRFAFRDPKNARLLLGWMAIAPICGVLAWRPHCFVYGPPKAGKSTLHGLATALLTPLALSTTGDSSEAGIRQAVGPDSLPVIIDEFESDQRKGRQQAIVMLARSASSGTTPVLRGTPEGKAMQFSLRTTFFFSGINPAGLSPADASRILLLELVMHQNDQEAARHITTELGHFADAGPRWCGYMASKALLVSPARDAFEAEMPGLDARLRTNIATLLGAAFVALNGRVPVPEEVKREVAEYASTTAEHAEAVDRDDATEALHHLLAFVIAGSSLGQWLAREHRDLIAEGEKETRPSARFIASLDIMMRVRNDEPGFYLLRGAPGIERIFKDTKWAGEAWTHAIRKMDGAFSPKHPVYFANIRKKARAIGLSFDILPDPTEEAGDGTGSDPAYGVGPRY